MVDLNLRSGKTGETPSKTYPDPVSSTTKTTQRDRGAKSGLQGWKMHGATVCKIIKSLGMEGKKFAVFCQHIG